MNRVRNQSQRRGFFRIQDNFGEGPTRRDRNTKDNVRVSGLGPWPHKLPVSTGDVFVSLAALFPNLNKFIFQEDTVLVRGGGWLFRDQICSYLRQSVTDISR